MNCFFLAGILIERSIKIGFVVEVVVIEKAWQGSKAYWTWLAFLSLMSLMGVAVFVLQSTQGLTITGMGRDTPWGLYIGQLTFMVGIAASAVMVVLPYYLHDFKAFGAITVLGEFLAIPAVITCMLFVAVDMGRPDRLLNLLLHPSPSSPMFWDLVSVSGYLLLNVIISFKTLFLSANRLAPPLWLKTLIFISIPWALSIHTVTAFLYSGLVARPFWASAIMAPRFLASAFATGPALLILIIFVLKKAAGLEVARIAIDRLSVIVTYSLAISLFFLGVEMFTIFYGNMPHHLAGFVYQYFGWPGQSSLVPMAWTSLGLTTSALGFLLVPRIRKKTGWLVLMCAMVIVGLWLEKGYLLVIVGFVPNALGEITTYTPTLPEILLTVGIYAFGMLLFSLLAKIYLASARPERQVLQ